MLLRTRQRTRRAIGLIVAAAIVAGMGAVYVSGGAPVSASSRANRYLGSLSKVALNGPIVGIAATPTGHGYWLVASDGGIFTFGDAHFHGSLGRSGGARGQVVGIARSAGGGYWLASQR